jgi:prolyl 4-hydroxylase
MASDMSTAVKLSRELKAWITHNLDRGCAPERLIQSMIGEKFEPSIARGVIEVFVRARMLGEPITDDTLRLEPAGPEYCHNPPRLPDGNMIQTTDRSVAVTLRLRRPTIAVLANVLDAAECDQLIALAGPRLTPSTVVDPQSGANRIAEHRNSEGMFFRLQETPFIARLDLRISQLMNSPVDHGEGLQVLRYGPGSQSTPHFDFLIPSNTTNERSLARSGQRVSSLVIYLNDVPSGGETVFPEVGLSVVPRRGQAVYFEYCNNFSQLDHLTLHAGAPVIAGEKWAVTKWMRQRRFVSA